MILPRQTGGPFLKALRPKKAIAAAEQRSDGAGLLLVHIRLDSDRAGKGKSPQTVWNGENAGGTVLAATDGKGVRPLPALAVDMNARDQWTKRIHNPSRLGSLAKDTGLLAIRRLLHVGDRLLERAEPAHRRRLGRTVRTGQFGALGTSARTAGWIEIANAARSPAGAGAVDPFCAKLTASSLSLQAARFCRAPPAA